MITCNTVINAINSVSEDQTDVNLIFGYMDHELLLRFFKTLRYSNIVSAMADSSGDPDIRSSYVGALHQRFKSQANGTFFSMNERDALAIKAYLEKMGCSVDYQKVARAGRVQ